MNYPQPGSRLSSPGETEMSSELLSTTGEKLEDTSSLLIATSTIFIPFMEVEKAEPQEQIRGLDEDGAAGVLAPGLVDISRETNPGTQRAEILDEVSSTLRKHKLQSYDYVILFLLRKK